KLSIADPSCSLAFHALNQTACFTHDTLLNALRVELLSPFGFLAKDLIKKDLVTCKDLPLGVRTSTCSVRTGKGKTQFVVRLSNHNGDRDFNVTDLLVQPEEVPYE